MTNSSMGSGPWIESGRHRIFSRPCRRCVRMIGIAAELMLNAGVENNHLRFAVFHSAEMLVRLEKEYDARWHSELRGPS